MDKTIILLGLLFLSSMIIAQGNLSDYSSYSTAITYGDDYSQQAKYYKKPDFSWNKIPRWIAIRNKQPYTTNQAEKLANNYQVIMLEKANKAGFDYTEEGIEDIAGRIKAINANAITLFYWNSVIHYGGYEANLDYDSTSWSVYDPVTGAPVLFKNNYHKYNYDVDSLRNWWISVPTNMVQLDDIDGVFFDKISKADFKTMHDNQGNLKNNYAVMLKDAYDAIPKGKIVTGNTLRGERNNGNRGLMEFFDCSYLERWHRPYKKDFIDDDGTLYDNIKQTKAEALELSIQLAREASSKGKMILFNSSPKFILPNANKSLYPTDHDSLKKVIQEGVYFPLAMFLMFAEEDAYFGYKIGPDARPNANKLGGSQHVWNTTPYVKEFDYYLGPPAGPFTKNGNVYSRSFENLEVTLNVATRETTFNWHDTLRSSSPDNSLDSGNRWIHNYQTLDIINPDSVFGGTFIGNVNSIPTRNNTSTKAAKLTRDINDLAHLIFDLAQPITSLNAIKYKLKLYVASNDALSTDRTISLNLRKNGLLSTEIGITLPIKRYDQWVEYEFDLTGLNMGTNYYNQLYLTIHTNDHGNSSGNVYYLDAFQGPSTVILDIGSSKKIVYDVKLMPNPASTKIQISEAVESLYIYDALGSEVLSFIQKQTFYDISMLNPGVYFCQGKLSNGDTYLTKMVKVNE